jgi:hypothetical protein
MASRALQAVQAAGIEHRVIRHGPVSALSPRGPSSPAKGWPDVLGLMRPQFARTEPWLQAGKYMVAV